MNLWKRKLLAYLHDPPSKCADLGTHEQRSERALRAAGFTEEELRAFAKLADITASSADRFPFPGSRSSGMTCVFDGVRAGFHHPLGSENGNTGAPLSFGPGREVTGFEVIEGDLADREHAVQPVIAHFPDRWTDEEKWRARFLAHWRLWPLFAAEHDARFAFLPADTRLPDHTIWCHNSVVSALAACADVSGTNDARTPEELASILRKARLYPAFLKFQVGPVQEFIAQARSTRDLWSGSYLLSWLMAAGFKALSAEVGPDAVIYPNLRSQPLFDLHWRDDLWECVRIGDQSVWKTLREQARRTRRQSAANNPDLDLLTPNLPNVFLAVVPASEADRLAKLVVEAIRNEWREICRSVWKKTEPSGLLELCPPTLSRGDLEKRFREHTERFLALSWQATPWPETLAEARRLADCLPADHSQSGEKTWLQRFDAVIQAATQLTPKDHRDPRYFEGGERGPKDTLNNSGLGWSLLMALNAWQLDAVRHTRLFPAWGPGGGQHPGVAQSKDALTGREEMLFGGSGFAESVTKLPEKEWSKLFKHDDEIGAITLVKRVWHWAYLADKWKLRARGSEFLMPNTRGVAAHDPFAKNPENDAEESPENLGDEVAGGKYFAVLALDGDSIGKWVSGEKSPAYQNQLANYWDSTAAVHQGSMEYFERESDPDGHGSLRTRFADFVRTRRLVSPSYHLQFSEALSNFAILCARPIVEAFDGRLIYAGGDDVVALVPADTALACAKALRTAFTGTAVNGPDATPLLSSPAPGFLSRDDWRDEHSRGRPIPFLVPGPAADCSVGIAIAHFKAPLQDVVREAQAAEKRAKKELGRSALAVTLMKRSGETIHWGCQWDSGGLDACAKMVDALHNGVVSAKFPHRIVELVDGYQTDEPGKLGGTKPVEDFENVVADVLACEVATAIDRQRGPNYSHEKAAETQQAILDYLRSLQSPKRKIKDLIGLCQTVAFIERNLSDVPRSSAVSAISNLQPEVPTRAER